MQKIVGIQQGESLPFKFDRNGEDISGWTCVVEVKQFPGDTAPISRAITPTDNAWSGFLTSTETAALAVGLRYLTATLTNATTDEKEQIPKRFQVSKAWA